MTRMQRIYADLTPNQIRVDPLHPCHPCSYYDRNGEFTPAILGASHEMYGTRTKYLAVVLLVAGLIGAIAADEKKSDETPTIITSSNGEVMNPELLEARLASTAELRQKNRELEEISEFQRERLQLLREERNALHGQAAAKHSPDDEASEELKKANARLQKELDKAQKEIRKRKDELLRKKDP